MKDKYDPLLKTDQDNINRQFKKRIEKLEKSASNEYDDSKIKSDITSLEARIKALEDAS